jgi:DNA-binding NarL/FixJ family response regulator
MKWISWVRFAGENDEKDRLRTKRPRCVLKFNEFGGLAPLGNSDGMRSCTVFLICENRLLREALVRILSKKSDLTVVGACGYSSSVVEQVKTLQAQVVLLDSLGLTVAEPRLMRRIREKIPAVRTVMVGMEPEEENFLQAVREGATGYVLRDASAVEVLLAIRAVAAGEAVGPPRFSAALFRCAAQQLTIRQNLQVRSGSGLSRREQQLVELIRWGLTNKEIASRLNLSEHTVTNHVHRILRKTGTFDRIGIVEHCHGGHALSLTNPPMSV